MIKDDESEFEKSELIAKLSHEMRTPLAAILGYAEMMYDARQTVTERMGCIGRIRQNVRHLTSLIEDIMDLARVEAGRLEIKPEKTALVPELGELFSAMETRAWKKRLSLDLKFEGPIPDVITTDALRFRQILGNVVENSIDHTDRGGIQIIVRYVQATNRLEFVVNDTGCGIRAEDQATLFEPWLPGAELSPSASEGLGLRLSRQLARAMGGDLILVQSIPGRGSSFLLTLDPGPLEGTHFRDDLSKEQLKNLPSAPAQWDPQKLKGMRILLVEDATDIQVLVSHFLRKSGAHVEIAGDGLEGVRKAKEGRFDLVLMDLQMPLLDGLQATHKLRTAGFRSPIVALTAHAMQGMREKCLAAGCRDYLTKPINAGKLIELSARYRPSVSAG